MKQLEMLLQKKEEQRSNYQGQDTGMRKRRDSRVKSQAASASAEGGGKKEQRLFSK